MQKQKALAGLSLTLTMFALAVFLLGSPSVACADEDGCATCEYGGKSYSQNACVNSCFPFAGVQTCDENGGWTDCGSCGGHQCKPKEN